MALDNTEFIDRDLVVQEQNNVGSNRIRLRELSFSGVSEAFREFRKKQLEEQVSVARDELAGNVAFADADGKVSESEKEKVFEKAAAIAKLEEQIKILDRETIPQNFVKSRAIKLLDTWLDNCRYNGHSAYSVGLEKADELFASAANEEGFVPEEVAPEEVVSEVPAPEEVTPEEVVSEVPAPEESMDLGLSDSDVEEQIDDMLKQSGGEVVEPVADLEFDDTEEVADVPVESEEALPEEAFITDADVQNVVESEFGELEEEPMISKNPEAAARVDRYVEDGPLPFVMPDISQEDLLSGIKPDSSVVAPDFSDYEFDDVAEADKERMPVIVPPRVFDGVETTMGVNADEARQTDESEEVVSVNEKVDVSTLSGLKQRLLDMREKSRESNERMVDAKRLAQETDERAAQVRAEVQEMQVQYKSRVEKIKEKIAKLEELQKAEEKETELAYLTVEANQRFIDDHQEKMAVMTDEMAEINSLLSLIDEDENDDTIGVKSV